MKNRMIVETLNEEDAVDKIHRYLLKFIDVE